MRSALACAVLMALAFDSMAQATPTAQVEVRFEHPEKFRDASLNSQGYERGADEQVMKTLTAHLQKLGQRYLRPGQQLRIDIRTSTSRGVSSLGTAAPTMCASCAKSPGRAST